MQCFNKYYQKSWQKRLAILKENGFLDEKEINQLETQAVDPTLGDTMIENFVTQYQLPEGLAMNYVINGKKYVVPMVTEEPSVVAAASNGARLVKFGGGFQTKSLSRLMIGQIAIENVTAMDQLVETIDQRQDEFLEIANHAHPSIVKRGGGARWIRTRILADDMLSVDMAVDVQEAMGANMLNTMLEAVADEIRSTLHQDILMSILSNYATECLVSAHVEIPVTVLAKEKIDGATAAAKIAQASRFAHLDPYRAATNNKGIMNGIDAVVIASGNDWRAIEAGAHAYAARDGQYRGLSQWRVDGDQLIGDLTMPMPVGSVGGSIKIVPLVKINHHLMKIESAVQLAQIIVAVGLGQNLAALYALVTDGIQRGHMRLQLKSLAASVGATKDEIPMLVNALEEQHARDSHTAEVLLKKIREEKE